MTEENRGRKRISDGGKRSPREVFVDCASIINGKLVHKRIQCHEINKESTKENITLEARNTFKSQYNEFPQSISNPLYDWKGTQTKQSKAEVNIDTSNLEYVRGKKAIAIHNGWEVVVRWFEGLEDVVDIKYRNNLECSKRIRPRDKAISIHELSELKYMQTECEQNIR